MRHGLKRKEEKRERDRKREKEIGKVPAGPTNTMRHETESQRESRKRGNEK